MDGITVVNNNSRINLGLGSKDSQRHRLNDMTLRQLQGVAEGRGAAVLQPVELQRVGLSFAAGQQQQRRTDAHKSNELPESSE